MTGLEDLTQAVTTVAGVLETHRVPYFVTGSLASSAHAEFRATNDIDIVADFTSVNLRDLMHAFDADSGFGSATNPPISSGGISRGSSP